ncbi:MAG: hypothetical protein Q9207_000822 [Kuettlingeria erythrocarpa]
MASTSNSNPSFNILGSSKLNTSDGKNPAPSAFNILGSSKLNTSDGKNPAPSTSKPSVIGSGQQATGSMGSDDHHRQCAKAHNELEARLRDEELYGRSRGW